jgi:hypothetical protein
MRARDAEDVEDNQEPGPSRKVDGRPRIIADPPLVIPITDLLPKQMDQAAFAAQ